MTNPFEDALGRLQVDDEGAFRRLRARLLKRPSDPEALCDLAEEMVRLEDGDRAVAVWTEVVQAEPKFGRAWDGLGDLFERVGALDDAAGCFEAALGVEATARRHFRLARALHQGGDGLGAGTHYSAAIALDESLVAAHFNLANLLVSAGRLDAAESCYRAVVRLDPRHARAHGNLGVVLRQAGRSEEAIEVLTAALRLDPKYGPAQANLASLLEATNRLDEARVAADRALRLVPKDPLAGLVRARIARRDGDLETARIRIATALESDPPGALGARTKIEAAMIADRLGDADAAFAAWTEGQAVLAELPGSRDIDRDAWPSLVARIRASTEAILGVPAAVAGADGPPPVFMVGFPRSGTTLTEQILAAHPDLVAAEERPFVERAFVGSGYPATLAELDASAVRAAWRAQVVDLASDGTSLVDKLPLNLVHAPLLSRAFPDGRLIVSLRDPRDVCLSAFAQDFVLNEAMIQFTSLKRTAELYAAVMGLWLEVRERLEMPTLEVRYEDLVADLPGEARRLLEFLEVPWDDRVLRYHEVARQRRLLTPSHQDVTSPIFTRAAGRWRRYREHLEPVRAILAPFVRALGYEDP